MLQKEKRERKTKQINVVEKYMVKFKPRKIFNSMFPRNLISLSFDFFFIGVHFCNFEFINFF
jgi:hypothetical protein